MRPRQIYGDEAEAEETAEADEEEAKTETGDVLKI